MSFNKIFKGTKQEEKKRIEEAKTRIMNIVQEYGDVNNRRSVTVFELADVLINMLDGNHQQMASIIRGKSAKIAELEKDVADRDKRIEDLIKQSNDRV